MILSRFLPGVSFPHQSKLFYWATGEKWVKQLTLQLKASGLIIASARNKWRSFECWSWEEREEKQNKRENGPYCEVWGRVAHDRLRGRTYAGSVGLPASELEHFLFYHGWKAEILEPVQIIQETQPIIARYMCMDLLQALCINLSMEK